MPYNIVSREKHFIDTDAVVNVASTDGRYCMLYNSANEEAEQKIFEEIAPGQVKSISGEAFAVNFVIYATGPVWVDGEHGEWEILRSYYRNSLSSAEKLGCESIALPLISTSSYGFPGDEAGSVAMTEIREFLLTHEMEITLVVFDKMDLCLPFSMDAEIDEYIANHYDPYDRRTERNRYYHENRHRRRPPEQDFSFSFLGMATNTKESTDEDDFDSGLDHFLNSSNREKTFQQKLFELIDASDYTDAQIYRRANMDRRLFAKIRANKNYEPNKSTAISLAIALKLDMDKTEDLLNRAGYTLSQSEDFDLLVRYFISNERYDINDINIALYKHNLKILGTRSRE